MKIEKVASIFGGLGLIIGAMLPWTTYDWPTNWSTNEFVTKVRHYGYEVLGLYTGVIGIIIIILIFISMMKNIKAIISISIIILSIISFIILIMTELCKRISEEFSIGFVLSWIATIITLIGGITMKNQSDEENKINAK
jgi:uncharacterized membrane protein YecN with MAPEG domain